jgi:hypothetical protein
MSLYASVALAISIVPPLLVCDKFRDSPLNISIFPKEAI